MVKYYVCAIMYLVVICQGSKVVEINNTSQIVKVIPPNPVKLASELTICLRFELKRESMTEFKILFYDSTGNFVFDLNVATNLGFLWIEQKSLIFSIPEDSLQPNQWNHLCIALDKSQYFVVANGIEWFSTKYNFGSWQLDFQYLIIGGAPERFSQYDSIEYIGSISELNIWNEVKSLSELQDLSSNCQVPTPDLFKWTEVEIQDETKETNFCGENGGIAQVVPKKLMLEDAIKVCRIMNAKIPFPMPQVMPQLPTDTCGNNIMATIKRNKAGSWYNAQDDQTIDMNGKWEENQPNGLNLQECTLYHSQSGLYSDIGCFSKRCFICRWQTETVQFLLKGLCEFSNIDHHYTLDPTLAFNDYIAFVGNLKNFIVFSKARDSWVIVERKYLPSNESDLGEIIGKALINEHGNGFPIGTMKWEINDEHCNETRPLKLTKVS